MVLQWRIIHGVPPHVAVLQELCSLKVKLQSLIDNFISKVKTAIEECDLASGTQSERMKVAHPQRMLVLLLDAAWVFHAGKRVRGSDLPLWSLTNWYYHYDLTPCIAKPGLAFGTRTCHSEPQLRTTQICSVPLSCESS